MFSWAYRERTDHLDQRQRFIQSNSVVFETRKSTTGIYWTASKWTQKQKFHSLKNQRNWRVFIECANYIKSWIPSSFSLAARFSHVVPTSRSCRFLQPFNAVPTNFSFGNKSRTHERHLIFFADIVENFMPLLGESVWECISLCRKYGDSTSCVRG